MVKLIENLNRRTPLGMAAFLISGSYLASRLLGLLRDRLLAAHFGIGPTLDAYTAAFRLPELLFTLLVSGAFAVAFIPVLTEHWEKEEKAEAWEVASSLLNLLAVITLGFGIIAYIFADPLTTLIAPGFDPERHRLTVDLTRIMLVTPFFFAVSSVFGSIQQAFNRFFFFSLSGIFYNLGIIFGIVALSGQGIYGVAIGVVLGAFIQGLIQVLGLIGLGYRYRPSFKIWSPSVAKVVRLMIPRSIDQGIDQLTYTAQTIIGSTLTAGSLTAYYYANNLKNVPLVIFGSAIATAAFPRMASLAARHERQKLIEDFVLNARLILFLVIPAATFAIIMRGYIVRLLFGFGNQVTADTLGWFAAAIVFNSLFFLVARMFYALQDSKTPLYVSLLTVALTIGLSLLLAGRFGVSGLAMAQSAALAAETLVLVAILKRRLGNIGGRNILRGIGFMLLANTLMASVVYIMVARIIPLYRLDRGFMVVGPKFLAISLFALLAYLVPCYILELREAKLFVARIKAGLSRSFNLD